MRVRVESLTSHRHTSNNCYEPRKLRKVTWCNSSTLNQASTSTGSRYGGMVSAPIIADIHSEDEKLDYVVCVKVSRDMVVRAHNLAQQERKGL